MKPAPARPVGRKFGDRRLAGQFYENLMKEVTLVDIKKNIASLLDRATEKQLRLIYLVAYEIIKKPTNP